MDIDLATAHAIEEENITELKRLYEEHPEYLESSGAGDLRHAAGCNSTASIGLLVSLGVDINALGYSDDTPLSGAALMGAQNGVAALLELGADVNFGSGRALGAAAYSGELEISKVLVSHGASLEFWKGGIPRTVRDTAMQQGHEELAAWLESQGCPTFLAPSTKSDVVSHFDGATCRTIQNVADGVDVHVVEMSEDVVFVTEGLSRIPQTMEDGSSRCTELMLRVPSTWAIDHTLLQPDHSWPLGWIIDVAEEMVKEAVVLKQHPVIISNYEPPQPLGYNTSTTCWFIFDDMSDISKMDRPGKEPVHFYTMYPFHTNERNFEKRKGYLPLIQHWTELGLDMVIHPERPDMLGGRVRQLFRWLRGR